MKVRQIFSRYDPGTIQHERAAFCSICGTAAEELLEGGRIRSRCPNCGYIEYRNPSPAVSVLLVENGRVLLGRRAPGTFEEGKWCMPCGFVEYDEDFLTAAVREVFEETGLKIRLQSIINVTANFLAPNLHSIVIVFLAKPAGGELTPGDDMVELQWAPLAGPYPEMAFEADEEIIKRFASTIIDGLPVDSDFLN